MDWLLAENTDLNERNIGNGPPRVPVSRKVNDAALVGSGHQSVHDPRRSWRSGTDLHENCRRINVD